MSLCRYVAFKFALHFLHYLHFLYTACIIFCLSTSYSLYYFHLACIFFMYLVSFLPNTSFKKDTTLCFHFPHPSRAQLLFIFCIIIHLAFISTTISRPGKGNRLLPLKREGRRGAYADRDDDVSVGYLVLFT